MSIWHSVIDTFNKEKALVVAFSRHCKISRRPVDSFSEDIPACAHVDISIIPVWLRRSLRSSNTDIRHLFVSPSVAAFSDPFIVHGGLFLPVVIFRMYPYSVLLDSLHASITSITTNTAQTLSVVEPNRRQSGTNLTSLHSSEPSAENPPRRVPRAKS